MCKCQTQRACHSRHSRLVNALNVTEEKIKEDRRQKMKKMKEKMIKAKYLAAKIRLLNRYLAKTLKELDKLASP